MLDLRRAKLHCVWIAMLRQSVNNRAAGISESEYLRYFIESFSGSVVARVADILVCPARAFHFGQIQMRVSAGHHQREHRKPQLMISLLALFQKYCVNMTLEMINRHQRFLQRPRQGFRVRNTHQQRARQTRTLRHSQRIHRFKTDTRIGQRLTHYRDDVAQMLARGQLWHNSAVRLMRGDLREHYIRNDLLTRTHDRRRSLVTRAFNSENIGICHHSDSIRLYVPWRATNSISNSLLSMQHHN